MYIFAPGNGEMPEWSNGADSKSVELLMWFLGFESISLRHVESQEATTIGQILQDQILAGFFLFWGIVKTSAEKALKQVAEYPNRYLKTLHPIR